LPILNLRRLIARDEQDLDDLFEDVEIMEMRVKCFSEGV
jgi:hypothetical protein